MYASFVNYKYEKISLFSQSCKVIRHSIEKCRNYFNAHGITKYFEDVVFVKKLVKKYFPKNIDILGNVENEGTQIKKFMVLVHNVWLIYPFADLIPND